MGSMHEAGSRPAAGADMDTDRVHPEAVSDNERDFEKQDSKPEYQDAFGDEEYAEVKYKTLSWCVFSAVLIVMIAVGVQRPWHGGLNATVDTNLYKAFLAVCNIVFSFCRLFLHFSSFMDRTNKTAGHVAFFGFMAELRNPRDYPKSLFLLQGIDTCLYIIAAVVIYCYAGDDVTSPALGSASTIVKKVAYGIALPTIIIGGVVNGHVACKYIYVRMWRHSDRMHKRDLVATGSWVLIGLATWIVAWIIAEAIPVFNNLLSLVREVLVVICTMIWERVLIAPSVTAFRQPGTPDQPTEHLFPLALFVATRDPRSIG
ncbi:amino acid transporter, putative [Aspergillus fumigatus Af293]|uniref:Amino acid transporter, putative n=1 Tax=Aspergillus fumigatus (strain ATCC MYA-4609 / CBS 101355 / FGSC A1100 / Af293) TaxID=330879 RepID=Q4W9H8_ASPFU|nr:amino acid transporter, putative [Aspergillus fumigatus Af293]EAL84262.1 amino acid transporter, putative [Aspergillus fumigatus Af293]